VGIAVEAVPGIAPAVVRIVAAAPDDYVWVWVWVCEWVGVWVGGRGVRRERAEKEKASSLSQDTGRR
jgi:hypothetical protein